MPTLTPKTTPMLAYMAYMECLGIYNILYTEGLELFVLTSSHDAQNTEAFEKLSKGKMLYEARVAL